LVINKLKKINHVKHDQGIAINHKIGVVKILAEVAGSPN
jgi:hypothetical protein